MVMKTAGIVCAMAALPMALFADRVATSLSGEGWTADGVPVAVPHTWNAIDGADGGADPAKAFTSCSAQTYARKVVTYARGLPPPTPGKRQFIRFEGVSIKAVVRVNGMEVGRHAGAFTAFCFEITHCMKPSGNTLTVVADNRYDPDVPPIVGDFTMYGGIYRDVTLIETDPVCIDPTIDGGPGVQIDADGAGHVKVRVAVSGATDAKVTHAICGRRFESDSFQLPDVVRWSPETPQTYEMETVVAKGDSRDSVVQLIGFRSAEFRADGFCLNGKRRKIRGVCRHQDREGKGWAISRADEDEDMAWIRRIGADGVRCSHYPQSAYWYDLCDRNGAMAWCEVPFVNELEFTEAFRSNMTVAAREMLAQNRNHPSIVCWGLFNEIYSGSKKARGTMERPLAEVRDEIRASDPARGIVAASNRLGMKSLNTVPDMIAFNVYPGWYAAKPEGVPWYFREFSPDDTQMTGVIDRLCGANGLSVLGIGEYGAGAVKGIRGDMFSEPRVEGKLTRSFSEDYQAGVHYVNYRAILRDPRVWGAFVWDLFDSGSDNRKESVRHGINNKGLIAFDHKTPKAAFWFYKAWNPEPMLYLLGCDRAEMPGPLTQVCGFCNAGPVTLSVNGRVVGEKAPDEVKMVLWLDVPIADGENRIELKCGGLKASAVWRATSRMVTDRGHVCHDTMESRI